MEKTSRNRQAKCARYVSPFSMQTIGSTSNITPLEKLPRISGMLSSSIYVKRDDLYTFTGGGSKARKLKYILNDNIIKKYNAIVTAGSNQSNHLRVTSLYAAKLGWKLICIVHDVKPDVYEGNLKIVHLTDAETRFVQMQEVKEAMDRAMIDLKNQGYKPLYIWGGGHCVEGSLAYYKAIKELKDQLTGFTPDYIFVASGTGTTQAGIEIGVRKFLPSCKVIGISISRPVKRGKEIILDSMEELNSYLNSPIVIPHDITFDDRWIGNGYASVYPELIDTIKWAAKTEGLILDPTYTGKAFHALKMYIERKEIKPNSNIIFWHTGGLVNLLASKKI